MGPRLAQMSAVYHTILLITMASMLSVVPSKKCWHMLAGSIALTQ